ncbi:protein kintoun [Eupeodes corollae]|uniref:protein kintoun n=1 Tax=Eupeodes corollae TaxID=290404 RepID=UPI0024913CA8|nr:protein kintoun [Eupeodes corollae]
MSVNTNLDNLDITREEFDKLSIALHKEEFRKLFLDYCEEIQDPKNRKQYEDEIKQLEAERGVDVTFLNPEPGFVVETSVNGDSKCYLNIAKCEKIIAPSSQPSVDPKNGTKGLNWSIPHGLPPPRHDYDDQNRRCQVFDVLFHPEAFSLAEKNSAFKQCLVDTACNGIEREYKVRLDRVNIKFPNLNFKGIQRASIIRKLSETAPLYSNDESNPIDKIFPPKPEAKVKTPTFVVKDNHLDEYTKPKYVLKHRRPVDMSEMTYETDAKMNVTIPKELVVEIELPLLSSAGDCVLDVTGKKLYFVSEKPAKYKLNVDLPYLVKDKDGSAKFDTDKRKLVVTLPVKESKKERTIQDFYREDSGVESDIRDDLSTSSISKNPPEELETEKESELCHSPTVSRNPNFFLKNSINYTFPQHFDLNVLDETIAIVLNIRNVDNESIDLIKGDKFFHIQFSSIGAGYYPAYYAFYFEFVEHSAVQIDSVDAEAWDNNVVLSLNLRNFQNMEYYHAGLNKNNLKLYRIKDEFILNNVKEKKLDDLQSKLEVSVELSNNEKSVQIEIKPRKSKVLNNCKDEAYDELKSNSRCLSKKNRKNKKHRSFSESTCDDIKQENKKSTSASNNKNTKVNEFKQHECRNATNKEASANATAVISSPVVINNSGGDNIQIPFNRKQRSYSESRNQSAPTFKGILKHSSRYLRTMSDSCSSMEENMSYSCSIDGDLKCAHSISDIPEENTSQNSLSESCKKTVRFSDVIKKNIFRLDSSILGRRRLNQKKKNKKRALQRRHSEGDSADYEDSKSPNNSECCHKDCEKQRKSSKHDSGLDLSTQGKHENACSMRNRIESESSDLDSKNSLMFDIDM